MGEAGPLNGNSLLSNPPDSRMDAALDKSDLASSSPNTPSPTSLGPQLTGDDP
jgi:hypothetical protein